MHNHLVVLNKRVNVHGDVAGGERPVCAVLESFVREERGELDVVLQHVIINNGFTGCQTSIVIPPWRSGAGQADDDRRRTQT